MKISISAIIFFVLFLVTTKLSASKLEKGFEALSVYDFFKAKKIFYDINKSDSNPYSSYGLALIYGKANNPFYNLDSAGKYAYLSYNVFLQKPLAEKFFDFFVNEVTILKLADSIGIKKFQKVKSENNLAGYNSFLSTYYLSNKKIISEAVYFRDELEFNAIMQINRSDSTYAFLITHPQSSFYSDAILLRDREIYDEFTANKNAEGYVSFLNQNKRNAMRNTAYEKLFQIYRQNSDINGLSFFVSNFPQAPQNIEAWKLLFSLSVKAFSYVELKNFLVEHPEFPLKNSILKELELNKIVLYPYQQADFWGFIDVNGKFVINPIYDAVTDFYEGLSVVSKNDSVFYVNKENVNVFEKIYADASVFKNGIAPVKQNNKWFFINRQGQSISSFYDEINELSNDVYVVKAKEKYGALDHFGQTILEPKYDKLGDFKNDFAYYIEGGNYGFVSKSGSVHKAEFEWISDFNDEQIAVFRQNNKYGLINIFGKRILEPKYDQIITSNGNIFMLIQNNYYGFFSSNACFLSSIAYDYLKEKPMEFYTNGKLFKLIKKSEQSFIDENGHTGINFGSYDEINFAANDLIKVKKKNKYGYLDRKLKIAIPYKYEQAEDFADSVAMVKWKEKNILINVFGQEIFSSSSAIQKISTHYFTLNDGDVKQIINHRGKGVMSEVVNIQKINPKLFIVTLDNGEIKLLYDN